MWKPHAWDFASSVTHGHTIRALLKHGELPGEWDYDLIGASYYIVAAAIDLILKAHTISQLGDATSASKLVPALVCAERVVSVGTGSSLFSLVTALFFGRSSGLRTAGIAAIPLLFAFIVSGFVLHAHQAIAKTIPVIWCSLHNGSIPGKREDIPFMLVDFPAMMGDVVSYFPQIYMRRDMLQWYALESGVYSGAVFFIALIGSLWRRRNLTRALRFATKFGAITGALFVGMPLIAIPIVAGLGATKWLVYRPVLWGPIYTLAWFPQMGYFPITGMSIPEMDQIAAPLPIVVVAAIWSLRPLFKHHGEVDAVPKEPSALPTTVDAAPLVPVKPVPGRVAHEEVDLTDMQRSRS
ncbi:hypothetical protein FB451DRAFT_1164783 [Mycena latifolia]|nr:hypothetical protein FB451DRAFT_1164783 [Mycena latifolia]